MIIISEILMSIFIETNFGDIFLFKLSPSSEALSSHLTSTLSLAMWHGLPTQGWLFPILTQIKIVFSRPSMQFLISTIFCISLQWTPSKAPSLLLSQSTARFTSSTSTMTNTSHYAFRCSLLSSSPFSSSPTYSPLSTRQWSQTINTAYAPHPENKI